MRVVRAFPPNIAAIRACLRPRPTTMFTYGDVIYSPSTSTLPPDLLAHEAVHVDQQRRAGGPDAWWERYLADPRFRLEQEVAAYRAQYRVSAGLARADRRHELARLARDLASPMYGSVVSTSRARDLISRSIR